MSWVFFYRKLVIPPNCTANPLHWPNFSKYVCACIHTRDGSILALVSGQISNIKLQIPPVDTHHVYCTLNHH